jgi:hypothetical protein
MDGRGGSSTKATYTACSASVHGTGNRALTQRRYRPITPPPTTRLPSYSTPDWPGLMARTGSVR